MIANLIAVKFEITKENVQDIQIGWPYILVQIDRATGEALVRLPSKEEIVDLYEDNK